MFSSYKKIPTSDLNDYARQLIEVAGGRVEDVSFPCGVELRGRCSLRATFGLTRNTNEVPATMKCGDMLQGEESVVCRNCYAEYHHQRNGDVESIPLRGSREDEEAEKEVDEHARQGGLVGFVKKHPYVAAGAGVLFAAGVVGAAFGAYKAYSHSTAPSASTSTKPTPNELAPTKLTPTRSTTKRTPTKSTTKSANQSTARKTAPKTRAVVTDVPATAKPTTIVTTPTPVKTVKLLVHNCYSKPAIAKFTVCESGVCDEIMKEKIPAREDKTFSINFGKGFTSVRAKYLSEDGKLLSERSSFSDDFLRNDQVEIASIFDIHSLDKNNDGILQVRHSLLRFDVANRVDQVFEAKDGKMPKYAGVTIETINLWFKNEFSTADAYFAVIGGRVNTKAEYSNFIVSRSDYISFPEGISKLRVGEESYPKLSFSAQRLNELLEKAKAKGTSGTLCIRAVNVSPNYLSDIKPGKCG